jgi:hypothetical protein
MSTTKSTKALKPGVIIVKCEFITAPRIRMTARQDIEFASHDNTVKATVKAGETFYLAMAASLGDGMYYLVTCDPHSSTCWHCYCPARKPCKHENGVQADNNSRFSISPIEAHIVVTAQVAAEEAQRQLPQRPPFQPQPQMMATGTKKAGEKTYTILTPHQIAVLGTNKVKEPAKVLHASLTRKREHATLNGNRPFSLMR